MRARNWLWALTVPALGMGLATACGDSTGTGGSTSSSSSTSTGTTGSTTSSSSSSGTGGSPMASDTCPGAQVAIAPSATPVVLTGTTTGAKDDYKTFCADASAATSAPDVVYELDVSATCSLDLKLAEQGTFDGALSLRKGMCDMRGGGDLCVNQHTHGEDTKLELTAGTYYLVVDGANKTSGDFTITLSCTTPACGDGVLNSAEEQCEPVSGTDPNCGQPNTVNACKILESAASDTCPGTGIAISKAAGVIHVPSGPPLFNTTPAVDNFIDATCGATAGAPDEVFQINPTDSGKLIVMIGRDASGTFADPIAGNATGITMNPQSDYCQAPDYNQPGCWTHNIYLRSGADCASSTTIKPANCNPGAIDPQNFPMVIPISQCGYQCENPQFDNAVSIISADVTAGTPVWLFVDGLDSSAMGSYTLTMQLQ